MNNTLRVNYSPSSHPSVDDDTPTLRKRGQGTRFDSPVRLKKRDINTCHNSSIKKSFEDNESTYDDIESELHFRLTLEKVSSVNFGRFLDNHDIEDKFRAKMIDWMVEVLTIYKQKDSTIFRSIFIMDLFYSQTKEPQSLHDLHLTGITCMLIASKSEEVRFIKLEAMVNAIGRNKFTKEQILLREQKILETIEFRSSMPCGYELLKCALAMINKGSASTLLETVALQSAKMCLCSYDMLAKMSTADIILSSIIVAAKINEKLTKTRQVIDLDSTARMFNTQLDGLFFKKLELVQSFLSQFRSINPNIKNIECLDVIVRKLM